MATAVLAVTPAQAQSIAEFRVRGPNGAGDEFIRIYNDTGAPLTVSASSGAGWAVAASDGVARCVIPNGTVIPTAGSYLCTNSTGYSLSGMATGNATYTTDIPDNAGIALFDTSIGANFSVGTRLDAVGSTSEANVLYKEGAGYPALTPFSIDYGFYRDTCGKAGSITDNAACSLSGAPIDTDSNAADFVFVDTNGTSAGAGQRLGAPGPANLASPVAVGVMTNALFDSCVAANVGPNAVRDLTSDPANNSTFGTLDLRRTFTNTSGAPITSLRFRVIDLTTFPAPSGFADLRPRTSTSVVATVDRAPCGAGTANVTVQGTALSQPPSQPNGGGFNSIMIVPSVTAGTPLAPGASIDVRFLMGVQQTGTSRFAIVAEGTPDAGSVFEYCDGAGCPVIVPPTPTVPTMTEWAMILFGLLLAGAAAVSVQRRRMTV
ncbi:MAG: IPTL-CTERM sorting domain-containing protein [Brevundimonas sp.]